MKPTLIEADFVRAATALRCSVAAVKAVCTVEAPDGGFDAQDRPRILFEAHQFSRLTRGVYDASHPSISSPKWNRRLYALGNTPDARNAGEHVRLTLACSLNRTAGLQAASWGKFQIMGFNAAAAGFGTLQAFINAMFAGEGQHLDAFVGYVLHERLDDELRDLRWADFARRFNGPAYAENKYDTKLAAAYEAAKG